MKHASSVVMSLAMGFLIVQSAAAQIPPLIRYQGTLVDTTNVPLEGTYTLTFRLYAASSGGTAVWTETQPAIPISRGVFSVLLGQATPLSLSFDREYWLSTQVGIDAEMRPRQRLTSVPYAYRAGVADQTQDQPPGLEVDTSGTLTDGLIAYWKFEESGGTRDDQKGPQDLADHNTVTQAAGKKGNAAQFTRANVEYLSITDTAALSTGDIDFTIACWVYLDSKPTPNDNMFVVGKSDDGDSNDTEYRLVLNPGADSLGWFVSDGTNTTKITAVVSATGTWYFVVAWHDATANTIHIQVNNGTAASASHTTGSWNSTSPFTIGNYAGVPDGSNAWNGRIDEVGFWKRVLTAQERANLYNGGSGNTYSLGKAASPWLQADTGIAYTGGRIGIGTLSIPNILSVQQGSATDPIADSWTVYPSDRQHKHIIQPVRSGYLAQLKATELYEWTRTPMAGDGEAREELRKSRPTAEELRAKKQALTQAKARLPKFTTKRVGPAIDDANVPSEILTFNPDGTKAGIDLLAYIGYLHAALKEAALKLEELESRLPLPGRSTRK